MSKTKILIVAHKPCKMYCDDVYMPIQVGKAISKYDLGIQGDDIGDNISKKNPYYSELTAQYWAWKNLDCEYIGFCHYRRFFKEKFTDKSVEELMKKYDVVLMRPLCNKVALYEKLYTTLVMENAALFFKVIEKFFPEYKKTAVDYFVNNNYEYPRNMFLCRKDEFDRFAEWQFSVLSKCEEYFKMTGFMTTDRVYGYVSEYLLPIYFLHHNKRIKTMKIVNENGEMLYDGNYNQRWIGRIRNSIVYHLSHVCQKKSDDFFIPVEIQSAIKNII